MSSDLVCISVYDTKPVYILTNACSEISWTKKERKVWSKGRNEFVVGHFHRLNVIEFYNYNMGNVDLADQLRNYYRYDTQWHRNRKWWWAVFWWSFQVLLTNSYIMYRKYHQIHLSDKYLSHYDYIKQVALSWIDPKAYGPRAITQGTKRANAIVIDEDFDEDDNVSSICTVKKLQKSARAGVNLQASNDEDSSSVASKCVRVSDWLLDPMYGALKGRLDRFSRHFPEH